jgi:hypothetical protein
MGFGLLLRVTHTGKAAEAVHVSDVRDGIDVLGGAFGFRKAGAIYVPTPANGGESLLVYAGDVAVSFETGGIRKFIQGGYLTAEFVAGDVFKVILPSILDEGILLTETPKSIDFVGAGVTATTVGDDVTVTIPGGTGVSDHAALTNLGWLVSAHTGTAGSLAAFDGAGATSFVTGASNGDILYFNGTTWTILPPGTVSGNPLVTQTAGAPPIWSATIAVDTITESTAGNGVVVNTVRNYGKSATNPAGPPAPTDGDIYYNTALRMQMTYDGFRSKWLSVEAETMHFGRDGNTKEGQYYRAADGRVMSATLGWYAERTGTVVSLTYTRTDADAATFDIMSNGGSIATVASSATGGRDVAINADFSFGDVLAVRNQPGGNTTENVIAKIRVRWRV